MLEVILEMLKLPLKSKLSAKIDTHKKIKSFNIKIHE